MSCHFPLGPGSGPESFLLPMESVQMAPLLSYLSALDQTFKGVWAPYRMHKSTHVVLCFSGLDPKGMWAIRCLSLEYLESRNLALLRTQAPCAEQGRTEHL